MGRASNRLISLEDNDKVVVVGGGPSGAFFAIHLLREARRLKRNIEVIIIEKKRRRKSVCYLWECEGCNFGAGIISPRLNGILKKSGLAVPEEIIQGEINESRRSNRAGYRRKSGHW